MALNPGGSGMSNYGAIDVDVAFSDNDPVISNLCSSVTTNIYTINGNIKNLKGALQLLGTNRDNQGLRDNIHLWQLSANEVVQETHKKFKELTQKSRNANKKQKLQVEKLTNHFKEAVSSYSDIQKQVAEKLRKYMLRSVSEAPSDGDSSLMLEEEEDLIRKQKLEQRNLEFEQEMLLDRQNRVQKIEADILDVNQIMKELGALVHEQGSLINTIENNVESVHQNVEEGHQQLLEASRTQQKMRNRKFICLGIGVVVLIVLVIVIAVSFR